MSLIVTHTAADDDASSCPWTTPFRKPLGTNLKNIPTPPRGLTRHLFPAEPTTSITPLHVDAIGASSSNSVPFPTPVGDPTQWRDDPTVSSSPETPRFSRPSRPSLRRGHILVSPPSPRSPSLAPSALGIRRPGIGPRRVSPKVKRRRKDEEETRWLATVHMSLIHNLALLRPSQSSSKRRRTAQKRWLEDADHELALRLGVQLVERGYWTIPQFLLPIGAMRGRRALSSGEIYRAALGSKQDATLFDIDLEEENASPPHIARNRRRTTSMSSVPSALQDLAVDIHDRAVPVRQLVARMILRYRDKTTVRTRPRGAFAVFHRDPMPASPLRFEQTLTETTTMD